jgi:hypothetical protein
MLQSLIMPRQRIKSRVRGRPPRTSDMAPGARIPRAGGCGMSPRMTTGRRTACGILSGEGARHPRCSPLPSRRRRAIDTSATIQAGANAAGHASLARRPNTTVAGTVARCSQRNSRRTAPASHIPVPCNAPSTSLGHQQLGGQ